MSPFLFYFLYKYAFNFSCRVDLCEVSYWVGSDLKLFQLHQYYAKYSIWQCESVMTLVGGVYGICPIVSQSFWPANVEPGHCQVLGSCLTTGLWEGFTTAKQNQQHLDSWQTIYVKGQLIDVSRARKLFWASIQRSHTTKTESKLCIFGMRCVWSVGVMPPRECCLPLLKGHWS